MSILDVVSAFLFLVGAAFTLISAIGLHRMPDTFRRLHVATKPATFSIACTFVAAAIQLGDRAEASILVVALVLQFITAPVAAHLLGYSVEGESPTPRSDVSEGEPDQSGNDPTTPSS